VRTRALILSAALWISTAPAYSQGDSTVRGEVEGGGLLQGYSVSLYDLERHTSVYTAELRGGAFELRSAPPGPYMVTINNERGDEIYSEAVTIRGGMVPITIRLPKIERPRPISGAVSVRELQHRPTEKALRAAIQAEKFAASGDFAKSAASLEKAIALSPDFIDAHTNLGAQYIRLGRYADAVSETQTAIDLGGPTPLLLCNLAFAHICLKHLTDAMEFTRAALRIQPDDPHANFLYSELLIIGNGSRDEIARHLQMAAKTIPAAQEALERFTKGN
jgi:tetratricopeptide (TPR) repeat protein